MVGLFLVLERENAEKKEAESVVSNLKRQFATVKEKTAVVDSEIDQYTTEIDVLRRGSCLVLLTEAMRWLISIALQRKTTIKLCSKLMLPGYQKLYKHARPGYSSCWKASGVSGALFHSSSTTHFRFQRTSSYCDSSPLIQPTQPANAASSSTHQTHPIEVRPSFQFSLSSF